MPDISEIRQHVRHLRVEFDGHAIQIGYKPACYNSALSDELEQLRLKIVAKVARRLEARAKGQEPDAADDIAGDEELGAQKLSRLLADWDLTDQGKPWPLNAANIASLGYMWISRITAVIEADINPTPAQEE